MADNNNNGNNKRPREDSPAATGRDKRRGIKETISTHATLDSPWLSPFSKAIQWSQNRPTFPIRVSQHAQ